jgi:hypothetical protein
LASLLVVKNPCCQPSEPWRATWADAGTWGGSGLWTASREKAIGVVGQHRCSCSGLQPGAPESWRHFFFLPQKSKNACTRRTLEIVALVTLVLKSCGHLPPLPEEWDQEGSMEEVARCLLWKHLLLDWRRDISSRKVLQTRAGK